LVFPRQDLAWSGLGATPLGVGDPVVAVLIVTAVLENPGQRHDSDVPSQTIEAKRDALAALCIRFHVDRLEIFGSAAAGDLRKDSDLDFLVEFRRVGSMTPADQYFGLLQALEELFSREIDLLTDRSLRNPYFISSVEKTRQLLYAA
jgi:predicted nucleotidyltransferase